MQKHALRSARRAGAGFTAVAGLLLAGCSTASSGSAGSTNSPSSSAGSLTSATTSSSGSTSVVSSKSVPFPIAVGNTWTYKDTVQSITSGTSVDKVAAVTPVAGGQQVVMDSTITAAGVTTHSTGYFVFHPDGSISYPFSQFNSAGSKAKVTLLSGDIIWPSATQLGSGQVSHNTLKIGVTVAGLQQDLTAHITVKGAGRQTITVPAGTYSATVVVMTESETIAGIALTSQVTTWLATGVGPVKTEVTLSEGGSASTVAGENVLTSFTKG
jgi:hypothetical protein